jgi:enamine deaminase RidA (YjgF/YER057c/UK114 family)
MTLTAIEPDVYPWFPYRGFTFCLGLVEGHAAWTSGQSAGVFDVDLGKNVVRGTMAEQARLSYTKLLAVLAEAGLAPDDVVHVVENVTASGLPHYAELAAVRKEFFGDRALAVTTVAVDRLVRGAAMIEIELHGVPGGGTPFGAVSGWTDTVVREGHYGTLHIPTLLPVTDAGEVVAPGDAVAQYRYLIDRAEAALASAGLAPEHIVSAQEYLASSSAGSVADLVSIRSQRWGSEAAGGTVIMTALHLAGIEVSLDVIASRRAKTIVDPGWARFGGTAMAPAVEAAGVLYLSAIASVDRVTGELLHPDDLAAQATEVYSQLIELVQLGGGEPASIRSTIEFCLADRIGEYRAVAPVREHLLSAPWPASTGDLCTSFAVTGALLQTSAIAHRVIVSEVDQS